jgi:hypothetical protein
MILARKPIREQTTLRSSPENLCFLKVSFSASSVEVSENPVFRELTYQSGKQFQTVSIANTLVHLLVLAPDFATTLP